MKQPVRKDKNIKRSNIIDGKKSINNTEIKSSKLEDFFIQNYLNKLNIEYIQQFKAESIGRFYDFYLPKHRILIEIDGSYYHGNPKFYNKRNMNNMQLKNKRVDEIKNRWALINSYILIRFWEDDLHNNPNLIISQLKKYIH